MFFGALALSLGSFSFQVAAETSDRARLCDRTSNIIWEGANDLISAVPGIGDFAKFLISLSKIGNNVSCNGDGQQLTENRVEEIAHEVNHVALETETKAVLNGLAVDLEAYEGLSTLPSIADLSGLYNTVRDEEARISTLNYRALDIQVSIEVMKISFLNGMLAQETNPEQKVALQNKRRLQAENSLDYIQAKEKQLK